MVTLKVSGASNFHNEACLNVVMVEQSNSNSSPGQMAKQGMIGLDCCAASGWSRRVLLQQYSSHEASRDPRCCEFKSVRSGGRVLRLSVSLWLGPF